MSGAKADDVVKTVKRVSEPVEQMVNYLALVALFLMMVTITANSVSRYLFDSPFAGVYKATELFFMPIAVFLTASYLQRQEGNVSVNIFSKRFSPVSKTVIRVVSYAVTLLIFAWVAQLAGVHALAGYRSGEVTTGVINFPTYLSWTVMSVGFALFCWRLAIQIVSDLLSLARGEVGTAQAEPGALHEPGVPFDTIGTSELLDSVTQKEGAEGDVGPKRGHGGEEGEDAKEADVVGDAKGSNADTGTLRDDRDDVRDDRSGGDEW